MQHNNTEQWSPFLPAQKSEFIYSVAENWGMTERIDKSGEASYGFFVDIKSFDEKLIVSLYCAPPICGVRWANESGRTKSGNQLRTAQPDLPCSYVYLVSNSCYIDWFLKESCGMHDHLKDDGRLQHYIIMTSEDIIDVLCEFPPSVFDE